MMQNSKKILVTTESREIFILRVDDQNNMRGFCSGCAAETEMLTLNEAVSFSGITALEMMRCIQSGRIHFQENANGHLFICAVALKKNEKSDDENRK